MWQDDLPSFLFVFQIFLHILSLSSGQNGYWKKYKNTERQISDRIPVESCLPVFCFCLAMTTSGKQKCQLNQEMHNTNASSWLFHLRCMVPAKGAIPAMHQITYKNAIAIITLVTPLWKFVCKSNFNTMPLWSVSTEHKKVSIFSVISLCLMQTKQTQTCSSFDGWQGWFYCH